MLYNSETADGPLQAQLLRARMGITGLLSFVFFCGRLFSGWIWVSVWLVSSRSALLKQIDEMDQKILVETGFGKQRRAPTNGSFRSNHAAREQDIAAPSDFHGAEGRNSLHHEFVARTVFLDASTPSVREHVLVLFQTPCFLMTPNSTAATSYTSVLWLPSFLAKPMNYSRLRFKWRRLAQYIELCLYDTMKLPLLSRGQS
jgi:hypothetical protein